LALSVNEHILTSSDSLPLVGKEKNQQSFISRIEKTGSELSFFSSNLNESSCHIPSSALLTIAEKLRDHPGSTCKFTLPYRLERKGFLRLIPHCADEGMFSINFNVERAQEPAQIVALQ